MKIKYITPVEYVDEAWVLSIGKNAPWSNRLQIRVPLFIARLFL